MQFIKKPLLISGSCSFTIDILLLIFFIHDIYLPTSFAVSPAFEPKAFSDQRNDWIQTIGNESANLKSDHRDLLKVDYPSDGKTLEATLWLGLDSKNASIYGDPYKRISYGILIKIASYNINTGCSGADYSYYMESVNGKWNEYLYQLSSTGSQVLLYSKTNYSEFFDGQTIGPDILNLI